MTFVKICGITNLDDAELAARLGADALGFNFYPKSPRYVEPAAARSIIDRLPAMVLDVGVFVNEPLDSIIETARVSGIGAVQLHGEETPEFASAVKAATGMQVIKAFRVSPDFLPEDVLRFGVDAILLDAFNANEHGGTGETFDWAVAKRVRGLFPRMYLAGGLGPANVSDAVAEVGPFAVDACSGLEESKGIKDHAKLSKFMFEIRNSNV